MHIQHIDATSGHTRKMSGALTPTTIPKLILDTLLWTLEAVSYTGT